MGVVLLLLVTNQKNFCFLFWRLYALQNKELSSMGRNASTRRQNDCTELEVKITLKLLWALYASQSAGKKKKRSYRVRVIDPHYHREIGLMLHNGSKEKYVWNTDNSL